MPEPSDKACLVPGCGGPASGVCINGLAFDECPDVVSAGSVPPLVDAPTAGAASRLVTTQRGGSLDAIACDELLRARHCSVVALVAGPDAGKTTLLATAYELVRRGRMQRFGFAGSETIRGFEERCHLARMASGGFVADTPRTPRRAAPSFLHLRLATPAGLSDLVLSDRSGEHFDDLLAKPGRVVEFPELARATSVLQLIDLGRMRDAPHHEEARARRLFGAMHQNGALDGKALLLVATKSDLLPNGAREAVTARLEALRADLQRRSEGRTQVVALVTASRARPGSAVIGDGLEDLVAAVTGVPAPPRYGPFDPAPRAADPLSFLLTRLARHR